MDSVLKSEQKAELYELADRRLDREKGESRWIIDEEGDFSYTEEAQDRFENLIAGIYSLIPCYWGKPYKEGGVWTLKGRRKGEKEVKKIFKNKKEACEGLRLIFEEEWEIYKNLEPSLTFEGFLKKFCTEEEQRIEKEI